MKILVLNGGGSKGLSSARFLQQFEQFHGPVGLHFDLICGVSTGAILGSLLANGVSATVACELYEEMLPDIFPQKGWRLWRGVTTPRYPWEPLEARLRDIWRETPLGHLDTEFMALGTRMAPEIGPKVWKSWDQKDAGVPVWQVVRASSAAPTYFSPHRIGDEVFVDGALSTNEPSMCALAEAVRKTGTVAQHKILTVRPGRMTGLAPEKAQHKGSPLKWLWDISGVMMQATEKIAEYQVHSLIGFAGHVVELGLDGEIDATGPEHNQKCLEHALKAWKQHEAGIKMQFGPA